MSDHGTRSIGFLALAAAAVVVSACAVAQGGDEPGGAFRVHNVTGGALCVRRMGGDWTPVAAGAESIAFKIDGGGNGTTVNVKSGGC
jgi:hypothetical protein